MLFLLTPSIHAIFCNCSISLLPLNSIHPVCMKQKMQPSDHTSISSPQEVAPSRSSGALKNKEPTSLVMLFFIKGNSLAIPQSIILTRQPQLKPSGAVVYVLWAMLVVSMMFVGFKSRWISPLLWKCSVPLSISVKIYFFLIILPEVMA